MLSNFTWWQFCGTFLLLCAFYYPFILWLYYKPSLQRFSKRFSADYSTGTSSTTDSSVDTTATDDIVPEPVSAMESNKLFVALEQDVRTGIKAAKDAGADKAQVMGLLKNVLLKYPELKQPGEQVKINELLIQECGRAGYVLYQAEAYSLWTTAPNRQL